MGLLDERIDLTSRKLPCIFLLDASDNTPDGFLNVVSNLISELVTIWEDWLDRRGGGIDVKIVTFVYSDNVRMQQYDLESISNGRLYIPILGGEANIGILFNELNQQLTVHGGIMEHPSYAPYIFLIQCGPVSHLYSDELQKLRQNNWFKSALKIAVAVGDEADREAMIQFTGNEEAVLEVHNMTLLKQIVSRFLR
jgi:uncharacterized protein YegL